MSLPNHGGVRSSIWPGLAQGQGLTHRGGSIRSSKQGRTRIPRRAGSGRKRPLTAVQTRGAVSKPSEATIKTIQLPLPLEAEVWHSVQPHAHAVICRRDVDRTVTAGVAEQGASRAEGLHAEGVLVTAITDEPPARL